MTALDPRDGDPLRPVDTDDLWDPEIGEWVPRPSFLPALFAGIVYGLLAGLLVGIFLAYNLGAPSS